ncbi:uncharacterized protein LOC107423681 isoform X2 [Ziziphus jujuba]|uniref:Uncharacterized protein LOC107423681 isoform X2 n=2 Tax=Ziziphus jujuba TaxID=326968 RepID=A0A6P4A5S6_ZIZJJ|nr:uncharacterized protein LOC107423681 isoform X2 [Ziziphus jujuba]KAH7519465.1 hypothetical protein FEM48_Zijuj08G0039100 [Ziziphus jujuba var. spinosa]
MAAAEARAVWQRAANRCFVQEDAKRAPKLACCQSPSSTSKQVEAGPTTAAYGPDYPSSGFRPFSRNSSYSNLSLDTRWWLQMQPNYGYQKGLTYEELNALESEEETLRTGIEDPISEISEVRPQTGESTGVDGQNNSESSLDVDHGADVCMKKASEVKFLHGKNMEELEDTTESCESIKLDSKNCPNTKQPNELCIGPEYNWMGNEKTEPWWRMTDRDELVSLVARKSLDHIENCDLPPPQKMCHRRHPHAHIGYLDQEENLVSSLDWLAPTGGLSNRTVYTEGFANSRRKHEIQEFLTEKELNNYGSNKPFSPTATLQSNSTETQLDLAEGELSKAQLIEALCHSQTRAREAEKAAKQAYADKEHIFSLFFKQASQLFAYKQWFRLLQLETLYIQVKNNDQQISTMFPLVLPWMSYKGLKRKPRKSWRKGAKSKRCKLGRPCHDITKYAVALALGLSLVGAGLFLGWTVGWMLPSF